MINDPYGLNKREATIESLRAEIEKQHERAKMDADRRYCEGLHEGRLEQRCSRELRQWCINVLIEKGKTTDAQALVEQASAMEQFILGEANDREKK